MTSASQESTIRRFEELGKCLRCKSWTPVIDIFAGVCASCAANGHRS